MLHDWLNQPGYLALFCLSFLASTLLPLGSEWLLAMMLVKGFDPLQTVAVATLGNCLGALTSYLVGIWGGGWLIGRVLRVSAAQLERAHAWYGRYGVYSLWFSWLPVIGDPLCLAAGMLRVNVWQFCLLVGSGKLVRYAVVAWLALTSLSLTK